MIIHNRGVYVLGEWDEPEDFRININTISTGCIILLWVAYVLQGLIGQICSLSSKGSKHLSRILKI
jgi:hypothetical protein